MVRRLSLVLTFIGALAWPRHSEASTITFDRTDLGNNEWQYGFFVSDRIFDPYQGFSIYFDPAPDLVLDVTAVTAPDLWDPIVFLPSDPSSPDGGFVYDALTIA